MPDDPTNYADEAIHVVSHVSGIEPRDLYVVWFCKTLQNWKALVSTDVISRTYYEVTFNGNKSEAYVDTYLKESNVAVPV